MKKLLIHDNNHHYELSINHYRVSAVLLERKNLQESARGVYSLVGL